MRKQELPAIFGGSPVRTEPFPYRLPGASMIGSEELKELTDVVMSKSPFRHYGYMTPDKVSEFENRVGNMLGSRFALAVSSGTGALFCAMAALGIGQGDEVIMPAFGWFSDYECVTAMGAVPVFAGIDDSLGLDPYDFERKITGSTKAVIAIHYQGGAAKMEGICGIASKYGIRVVEDNAQSFGGSYMGRMLGTIGDIGVTSFQVNKVLTCGEGGLLHTDDEELYARAVRYHDLGAMRTVFLDKLDNKELGTGSSSFSGCQFRMSELHGAFMLAQMARLPYILERCRKASGSIKDTFKGNGYFTFRDTGEGDCGITVFMRFRHPELAMFFTDALIAEGMPAYKSSSCCHLPSHEPIKSGYDSRGLKIYQASDDTASSVGRILSSYVPVSIGPLYTDEDVNDIIISIKKLLDFLDASGEEDTIKSYGEIIQK